jgi:serine/threonine-protein kinase
MIGSTVGSYKITDKIGEGGMGAVFKGVDVMLEREVAIKMLRPELSRNPQIVERFRTEAVTLAKLNHPYIATLYSFLREGDDFFMVMEYVRGETLDTVIRRSGAMSLEQAVALFCQALEGIEHAHKLGIVHRDIKPANMMLASEGTIKVMDFGIARVLGTDRMTRAGHLIGTVEYMSPEQVRGEETDGRSDVYSLGILLYEMLTGRVPFTSTSEYELMRRQIEEAPTPPRVFASNIPLSVEQVIMTALAKRPESRHQTAGEFRASLTRDVWGSATPLDSAAPVYAAPATRIGNPFATDTPYPGTPSQSGASTDPAVRETVLAVSESPAPPPVHVTVSEGASMATRPDARPTAAPFRTLNWKHYAAAAGLLVLLISVPLALIRGSGSESPAPVEATQPASVPSANPAPAEQTPGGTATQPDAGSAKDQPGTGKPPAGDAQPITGKQDPKAQAKQPEKKKKWYQKIPGINRVTGGEKKTKP